MSNEWEWEGAGEGLQSPDWCAEMQRRVNIGLSMGWVKPPVSEPVPASESPLAVMTDSERVLKAVPSVIGRRLTYKGLTGNVGLG
jgi:hypothetical protein